MNILDASWKILQKEYKLTKIIGQGTGGIVIKATHRIAKKDVAIKKIKCSFN
jgi:serine/threonine protein kinase